MGAMGVGVCSAVQSCALPLLLLRYDRTRPLSSVSALILVDKTNPPHIFFPSLDTLVFLAPDNSPLSIGCNDEAALSSDEECSGGATDTQELQAKGENRDLKNQLLRRFGNHISSLKLEFSKKKKKGKLPRDARQTLLDWWNLHDKWPYPTEADKMSLAESTGLDQRQINNWFINQRKRHWKPPENFPFAVMNDYSGQYLVED